LWQDSEMKVSKLKGAGQGLDLLNDFRVDLGWVAASLQQGKDQ
jgi:hypothetical protein